MLKQHINCLIWEIISLSLMSVLSTHFKQKKKKMFFPTEVEREVYQDVLKIIRVHHHGELVQFIYITSNQMHLLYILVVASIIMLV